MRTYSNKKKFVIVALIFILSSTMLLSYDNQNTSPYKQEHLNAAVILAYPKATLFVYNQYGDPVSGVAVSIYNGEKNITNNNGCAGFKIYLGNQELSYCFCSFYCTPFGMHNFNNISVVSPYNFYFSALVSSNNNVLDPAIMIHSFANLKPPQSHSISCAYLCCYKSNTTIQSTNSVNENVLQKYANFTTITVPITKYMTSNDNYEFSVSAVGLDKSYVFCSSKVQNITSSQSRPYNIIRESLFQITFISTIIALTGIIFLTQNIDEQMNKRIITKGKLTTMGITFLKSYIPEAIAIIISVVSTLLYSFFTGFAPDFTYFISLTVASLFLTAFMILFYSLANSYKKKDIKTGFIVKWAIIIELIWVGIFTSIEIGFIGSSDVFNPQVHLINTVLVGLQYVNPLEYAILIIDIMNGIILLPTALPGSVINYGLNPISIAVAGSIVLLLLIIANIKVSGKKVTDKT
ncbi:MAG: hypothetical protein M1581_01215 [Candidatus Thermoplasmatota archaeon]|nr:hypothetical protein [Candidatus Thermoplasmatota archaeon]